jgi:hypothetical protein
MRRRESPGQDRPIEPSVLAAATSEETPVGPVSVALEVAGTTPA